MFPYLYQSSSITIGSYGVMLAIAYLVGRHVYISNLQANLKTNINVEVLIISLLVSGVIGAKLMFILKNVAFDEISWNTLIGGSGFSSQGALLAAFIVIIIFAKLNHIPLSKLLDNAAPAAILAYAIARVGCFLSGDDCWGQDSDLVWAMSFPDGIKATQPGQTVHPLPLYEIIYSLAIWQYLNWQKAQKPLPYTTFFYLLGLWGFSRFWIEFISLNPVMALGMTGSQLGALIMFIAGVAVLTLIKIRNNPLVKKS